VALTGRNAARPRTVFWNVHATGKECTMRRTATTLLAAAIFGMLAPEAAPAADVYKLDPVHSVAVFKTKHLGVSYTYGLAPNLEGEFTYDPDNPEACAITVTAPALDITTEHRERDDHVLGEDFLNAVEHRTMQFRGTGFKKTGESTYEVTGDLTILAVTKPITIEAEFVGCGPVQEGEIRCGFDARFTIKRSDFGISAYLGPVGDEVTLMVGIEGIKQ